MVGALGRLRGWVSGDFAGLRAGRGGGGENLLFQVTLGVCGGFFVVAI